jgi:hypothetical protein
VGQVDDGPTTGIPWLTKPQRDLLAHLTTLNIQRQLPGERTYAEVLDALADLEDDGQVRVQADDDSIWVYIAGQSIVHAARDWLEWMAAQWSAAGSASN